MFDPFSTYAIIWAAGGLCWPKEVRFALYHCDLCYRRQAAQA